MRGSIYRVLAQMFAVAALLLLAASQTHGGSFSWSVPSGDWSVASNWNGFLPTGTDAAYIVNGGTATVTQLGPTCGTLSLGSSAGSGTVLMTDGSLATIGPEYIGDSGAGNFTQSGGTNSVSGGLVLGLAASSLGTYNLNGGLLSLSGSGLTQGGGSAAFNFGGGTLQAGASFSTSVPIFLSTTGSNGVVNTNGYPLSLAGPLSGPGGLQQVGSGTLTLSASNGYTGTTLISLGTLLLANTAALSGSTFDTSGAGSLSFGTLTSATFGGLQGSGNLTLNNTTTAAVALSVGGNNASTTFSGGLSGSGSLTKLGSGTFAVTGLNNYSGDTTVSAGNLEIQGGRLPAAYEVVGLSGTASLALSGGTNAIDWLILGSQSGIGTYNLIGSGLLSASVDELIGSSGTGSFVQSGGTHSAAPLYFGFASGSSGSYTLSGSGLLFAPSENIGTRGTGNFTQSGGTNSVSGGIELGHFAGSAGTYHLNGGLLVLSALGLTQGSGAAAFNFGGGTLGASAPGPRR